MNISIFNSIERQSKLNGITDIFVIPKIPKIPKFTTFSVKNSKNISDFFVFNIQFSSQNLVFSVLILKILKNTKQIPKILKKIGTFLEKQKILDSFAENVVHLGIFGISGIILKISVLLKFSIEIFFGVQ